MSTTNAATPSVTSLINVLTVDPKNQAKLLESLRQNCDTVVSTLPGWISTSFLASHDKTRVVIYSQWRDLASVESMRSHPQMRAYFPHIAALASFDSMTGDIVYSHRATAA